MLRHFVGRKHVDNVYSDSAPELIAGVRNLGWRHETSLPGVPRNNSMIERANQIILGGTTACLIQAGLPPCYWSYAAPTFCANYNAHGVSGGESHWRLTHGEDFPATVIPFGAKVVYTPAPSVRRLAAEKFDPKARLGVLAGLQNEE